MKPTWRISYSQQFDYSDPSDGSILDLLNPFIIRKNLSRRMALTAVYVLQLVFLPLTFPVLLLQSVDVSVLHEQGPPQSVNVLLALFQLSLCIWIMKYWIQKPHSTNHNLWDICTVWGDARQPLSYCHIDWWHLCSTFSSLGALPSTLREREWCSSEKCTEHLLRMQLWFSGNVSFAEHTLSFVFQSFIQLFLSSQLFLDFWEKE